FIFGCGTTHLMEVWTVWHGTYRLAGVIKAITAVSSVATAALFVHLVPEAVALPSPAQLRAANEELEREIRERRSAELALHRAYDDVENMVRARTAELARTNEQLKAEIVERKRAEENLRRSEEFLAEGQRLSHTGSWGWPVSSGELLFSRETFLIMGFDPEQPAPSFRLPCNEFIPTTALPWNRSSMLRSGSGKTMNSRPGTRCRTVPSSMSTVSVVSCPTNPATRSL